jgi:hypothetical protein
MSADLRTRPQNKTYRSKLVRSRQVMPTGTAKAAPPD